MNLRLVGTVSVVVLLTACGSGDGSGTRPTISVTLPAGGSVAEQPPAEQPPAEQPPAETAAPEQPPAETAAPETAAPETAPPETPAPETVPAEQAPVDTIAPADDAEDGTVWWPWVLGGILVIALIAALVARSRRNSSGTWQIRATTLLDDVDRLASHLPGLTPDGLIAVAGSDAAALATLRATLQQLIAEAPDAGAQASLGKLAFPMEQLHAALDSIALSGQSVLPGGVSAALLASQLHTASAAVRADFSLRR